MSTTRKTCISRPASFWEEFAEYREGTSFFAWAVTAARYEILNFHRTRNRRLQFNETFRSKLVGAFDELGSDLLQARLEALCDCKERLGEEDRSLLEACYGTGLSFRETAARLGRSVKNVYNVLVRIRAALMKCIEGKLTNQERNL